MDDLRQRFASMEEEENRLLAERDATADAIRLWTVIAIVASVLLGVLGTVLGLRTFGRMLDRELEARAEVEAARGREQLLAQSQHHAAELAAVNKEMESFSYSVSHDLRSPLRAIDGFSQALIEDYADKLDAQGKHALQRVRAGVQRMGLLIDDMLTLSRVTRSEMREEPVDLSAMARSIAAELKRTQPERQVEFAIAPNLRVTGDVRLLQLVIENLLGNAWKFTSKRPKARIEFGVTQHEGKPAFFVRDDGAGFDMTYADKLFQAFQRLHTEADFPGTGVGLVTVRRIVRRHGGEVWAEGQVEKGATFYFTLGHG
jgi:light-regulated signal transduction histidine kinase (bacteriophytochrome)